MTLTFDPLTLNMCGRSGIVHSTYVPNLSEIGESATELLMIYYRFFVRFRGTAILICIIYVGDIVRSSLINEFKNGEDILLGFQTTAAQIRALLSHKAKNRTF